jgi:hypothetical protein
MSTQRQTMSGACYECIHRRVLPGNTRSACRHPATAAAQANPLAGPISAMGNALPMPSPPGLSVIFDRHGIRMGWASWPYNFDPMWLVSCDGFTPEPEAA